MIEAPTLIPPKEAVTGEALETSRMASEGLSRAGDPGSLRSYTNSKLALAAQLRVLRDVIKQRGSERRLQQCNDLMAKLAEDRFALAVLGQFKRGKSSLMNAIIGRELLPVGVLPLTSAITVLRFGAKERLLITRSDVQLPFPHEEPVDRLAEFVTEKENPGNCKHVKTATVELPVPFLRRGLEFVDTPGVGSAIEANTTTTLNFLPECDAVLFVTSVDSPFTRVELEFLESIRQHVRKIFFVVNKTDLLGSGERQEILSFVRDTIRSRMGTNDVKVFPVSSRLGLAAKLDGDESEGLQSGLNELEDALASFLSGEKAKVLLAAIADKALRLLEQESLEVKLREHAGALPESELLPKLELLTAHWREHEAERRKLYARLREHLVGQIPLALTPELPSFLDAQRVNLASASERLLARAHWQPGAFTLKRGAEILLRRARSRTARWLLAQTQRLGFAAHTVARECWQRLASNLADIPALAASALGGPTPALPAADALPPWQLDVEFEPPVLDGLHLQVGNRKPWMVLPVWLTRRWLKRQMFSDGESLMRSCREQAIAAAATAVNKALDRRADEVEHRASEVGARVLAIITGKPLAASGLVFDGKPVLVDSDYGRAELAAVRERLNHLRLAIHDLRGPNETAVLADHNSQIVNPDFPGSEKPGALVNRKSQIVNSLAPASDFTRDLQTRSCPVCEHLKRAAFSFLSRFQYDLAHDEGTQQEFAEVLGFCALHTWQLEAVSSPVGASTGFAKFAEHVSKLLAARGNSSANGHAAAKLIRDPAECHVCRLLREVEQDYLRRLADFVEKPDGHAVYARSQGVCLRHLGLWLPLLADDETARFVLETASRRFEQMGEDMQSFSMKTEALRRELRNDDERDAYWRAIVHLVGDKGNCAPWNKDAEI